jgi:TonB family protein
VARPSSLLAPLLTSVNRLLGPIALAGTLMLILPAGQDPTAGPPHARAQEGSAGAGTIANTGAGPPVAMPADSILALQVARVTSLDSARTLQAALAAGGVPAFALVRATGAACHYLVLAGPFPPASAPDSVISQLAALDWVTGPITLRARADHLLRGIVAGDPGPAVRLAAADSTARSRAAPPTVAGGEPTLRPPRILLQVRPVFTPADLATGVASTVLVQVLVAPDGSVAATRLREAGEHSLDDAALLAASQCRFAPALSEGDSIAAWLEIPFVFAAPPSR